MHDSSEMWLSKNLHEMQVLQRWRFSQFGIQVLTGTTCTKKMGVNIGLDLVPNHEKFAGSRTTARKAWNLTRPISISDNAFFELLLWLKSTACPQSPSTRNLPIAILLPIDQKAGNFLHSIPDLAIHANMTPHFSSRCAGQSLLSGQGHTPCHLLKVHAISP